MGPLVNLKETLKVWDSETRWSVLIKQRFSRSVRSEPSKASSEREEIDRGGQEAMTRLYDAVPERKGQEDMKAVYPS